MDSPDTLCTMTSHQAIMKCPWQWRQPFLDEKLESRKRKVGDGCFYDPVDPNFVDHLLPGHAKKFCTDLLESDEKEQIQREIERLKSRKQEEQDELMAHEAMLYDSLLFTKEHDGFTTPTVDDTTEGEVDVKRENMALVDSILLMSKSVEEATQASSLLASPQSSFSSSDDEDMDGGASSSDEASAAEHTSFPFSSVEKAEFARSSSLELMSDNLQENFFAAEDGDLLDFDSNPVCMSPTTRDRSNSV